jgi:hypothetical protein
MSVPTSSESLNTTIGNIYDKEAAIRGKNINRLMNFKVASGFSWREPPVSWIGNIFPTESTYHPLVVNSDYEIAMNLYSLEGAIDDNGAPLSDGVKQMYRKKIRTIVEDSDYLQSLFTSRMIYVILIILIIILIIFESYATAIFPIIIILVRAIYMNMVGYDIAKQDGLNRWSNFENTMNSKFNSGDTPEAVLKKLEAIDEHNKEIQAKYHAAGMSHNTSTTGTNLAMAAAGFLTGIFSAKK